MMAKALFFVLLALSLGFLLNALRRREGILQFPALFAAAFVFSIIPQLVNHVFYPGRLPAKVYQDHGVEYGLIMCILCLLAGIAGYRGMPRATLRPQRPMPRIDIDRLFWAGAVLCLVGMFGAAKLAALIGGWKAQFIEGGYYSVEWSGRFVIWTYVAKMLPLGLILCLNSTLLKGTVGRWTFTLLMMIYPLANIVFLGRRSMVASLALMVVTSIWFQRRLAPPRWLALAGMALGGLLIILVPFYRSYANRTGDIKGAIAQIDVKAAVEAYATGSRGEGMDNLIIGIPARLRYPSFSFGSGFWNGAVAYLVPGQIIGHELKQGLMIRVGAGDDDVFLKYCGLESQYGSFATGPYSAFCEFHFLGCLLYFLIGHFYRWLWHVADNRRHLVAQIVYVACALQAPRAVVNSLQGAFAAFLLLFGILIPVLWFVHERRRARVRSYPTPDSCAHWPRDFQREPLRGRPSWSAFVPTRDLQQ